ncbi:MAG: winged helix-turn-helix transcriptional regulator [Desulfovibrio sp.]|nr:winged helix-turn-helix transcriptional regulator [Desulfovibrio sp.]
MVAMNDELRNFNLALAEIQGLYHEACVRLGVSDSACQVLYTVAMFGDGCSTPRDVYRSFGVSRQTVHSAVSVLERRGILFLEKGPGRERRMRLTESGRALVREKIAPLISLENALLGGWPEEDRRALLRLLRKYRDDLRSGLAALKPRTEASRPASRRAEPGQ